MQTYLLYFVILYYTLTLLPLVNTYAVLTANLNDFQSLAKKHVPNKNLVDQTKVIVLESGSKDNNGPALKEDSLESTVEYVEEEQEYSYEDQKSAYKHQLKKPPRVSFLGLQDASTVKPLSVPTVITVEDLIDKLKHRILEEIIDTSEDQNLHAITQPKFYKNVQMKPISQVQYSVPLNVFQDQIQFEGYEDTIEDDVKPQIHYLGQIQIPTQYLKRKPVTDVSLTKSLVSKKQRFISPKQSGTGQKLRYIKPVLVPANSKQILTDYILQSILDKNANIGQQQSDVKQSMLEPDLSLIHQQTLQLPLDQQPSIIQHLALMQQQIHRLNKIMEQHLANHLVTPTPVPTLDAKQNTDTIKASSEKIDPSSKEDTQKTNDKDQDEVSEDTALSEETTIEPVVTDATTVENEQFIEENEENIAGTTETIDSAHTETYSNADELAMPAEEILVKADNTAGMEETSKIHTQEFGNTAAGQPIVEKTYNFNAPIAEKMDLHLPIGSARKVMLF